MDAETAFHFVGTFGRYQCFLSVICFLVNMIFSMQIVLMVMVGATPNVTVEDEKNLTTIVTEFDLYDKQWVVDLIQSLTMGGFMVGCVVFGQVSDFFGRRTVLLTAGLLAGIVGTCSAFASSWQTFAVTRFFAGLFVGGSGVAFYVLLTEIVGKRAWAIVGVVYQIFFSLGICLLALLGYWLQKWRIICIVCGGLAFLFGVIVFLFLPESPRWLYSTGKIEKSEALLRKMARRNGKDERSIYLSPAENNPSPHTFVVIFRYRKLVIWLAAVSFIWFACGLIYYGLTMSAADLTPNLYLGIFLTGVIEIPGAFLYVLTMDVKLIGRKGTLLYLLLLCAAASIIGVFTYKIPAAKLSLGLGAKLAISACFNVIYVYSCEIFPTPLRSFSLGTSSTFARIGAIIASFVPLLETAHPFAPYLVFGIISAVACLMIILLPKTVGKPPPQTIEEVVGGTSHYKHLVDQNGISDATANFEDSINYIEPDPLA